MDLDVITTVLTVARTRSFSAAAYMIPCAQSSVSRRVDSAESELNVRLFTRPTNSVDHSIHLTSAGTRIIPIMEMIVDNYQQMFKAAAEIGEEQSVIRVGVKSNMMPPMSFSILKADFFEQCPNITVEFQFSGMDVLISELRSHQIDAIFFSCVSIDRAVFPLADTHELLHLGDVPLSMGISNLNPLSRRKSVSLAELKDENFLLKESSGTSYMGIVFSNYEEFCRTVEQRFGFTIHATTMNDAMLEIRYRLAQKNKGIFPSHTPPCWCAIPDITYVDISDGEHSVSYYLLFPKNSKTSAIRDFSTFLTSRISHSADSAG